MLSKPTTSHSRLLCSDPASSLSLQRLWAPFSSAQIPLTSQPQALPLRTQILSFIIDPTKLNSSMNCPAPPSAQRTLIIMNTPQIEISHSLSSSLPMMNCFFENISAKAWKKRKSKNGFLWLFPPTHIMFITAS